MSLQPEDKALLISVVAAVLLAIGNVLSGNPEYGILATLAIAIGGILKATVPAKPQLPTSNAGAPSTVAGPP